MFTQMVPAMLEGIVDNSGAASGLISNVLNSQTSAFNAQRLNDTNLAMQHNSFNNQTQLATNGMNFQQEMLGSQQTFQGNQNALNRAQTTGMFNSSLQNSQNLQSNSFDFQTQMQNSRIAAQGNFQSTGIKAMFGSQAMATAGNLVGSGLQFLANNQMASLQRQNFDYMTGKASDAYSQAGLPSYLAFSPSTMMNAMPRTAQMVTGVNSLSSSLPGNPMSIPWTGSQSQATFGVGDIPTAM